MTEFTKDELDVLAACVDMMVRAEGQAMSQLGADGLKEGRVLNLSRRLKLGLSALEKMGIARNAMDAVDPANPNVTPGG